MTENGEADCDYVVVGSGAGGGTVAARLAEAGWHVVLLEAGDDARHAGAPGLPEAYDVPAFHALASEHPAMRWDIFVRHYADDEQQRRDSKADQRGVLYPRASTLGGCTAHNALVYVVPPDQDWHDIAKLTGDASWQASKMRRYQRRVENIRYRPILRILGQLGINITGRGWSGWLDVEAAFPTEAFLDDQLIRLVWSSARRILLTLRHPLRRLGTLLFGLGDPNSRVPGRANFEGLCYTPLSTRRRQRNGTRERILDVVARHGDRLELRLHALATRVILDKDNRATGVEYLEGEHLYDADPSRASGPGTPRRVRARREVIIAGGAFNSPQLLMLSGIGPAAQLRNHGIDVRVDLAGVGHNLQDRYEVAVVNRMERPWSSLNGAKFEAGDPLFREWLESRGGLYISNGSPIALVQRSDDKRSEPDLFMYAVLAKFKGYFPGYSRDIVEHLDFLSWIVLKARTLNRAGTVTLASSDPRAVPKIDFNYFDPHDDRGGEDLKAVVSGIRAVRRLVDALNEPDPIAFEELPGRSVQSDEDLGRFVRDNAWGHHACGTCAIGPRERNGVIDSRFRVYGTRGLRVVDASVFPRIPGFFIASAIYIIAEKAADDILNDAQRSKA